MFFFFCLIAICRKLDRNKQKKVRRSAVMIKSLNIMFVCAAFAFVAAIVVGLI